MLGVARSVVGGLARAYELMRIEERDGALIFTALPSGQKEASFLMMAMSENQVVYSNPKHDFPQRISYRLTAEGSLLGRIEGTSKGAPRAVDFPMHRVACEARPAGGELSGGDGPGTSGPVTAGLDRLASAMAGSFSSEAKAAADHDYRDIRLHMVPIWRDRANERWLYVEQAVGSALDKPYRQRVYRLVEHADGSFESIVFTIRSTELANWDREFDTNGKQVWGAEKGPYIFRKLP